jgi:large subunit ribosomal protein L3
MQGILGQKVGMTAVFDDQGRQIPVTVISTAGNIVVDKRTQERDGYSALVLGFGEKNVKRVNNARMGFFEKKGVIENRDGANFVKRHLREFRVNETRLDEVNVGETVTADSLFTREDLVDVVGTSKGRGFSGVMKRHNMRGGKATHGVHEYYRHGGSIGSNTTPARVFKNKKMPGQYGNLRTTIQNAEIIDLLDGGLVLVRGGVPGPNGGLVMIKKAIKRTRD